MAIHRIWSTSHNIAIHLLRVDERCDADGDGEVETGETTWRTVEASTYGPGIVGNLLAKRVYSYPGGGDRCASNGSTDYYYASDHVGNVYMIFDSNGEEEYRFNQDAFGNELNFEGYTGTTWATAATAGIAEHQTGKWIDDFSGLYFFHARWYSSEVGRWLSREPLLTNEAKQPSSGDCPSCSTSRFLSRTPNTTTVVAKYNPLYLNPYCYSMDRPLNLVDPDGEMPLMLVGCIMGAVSGLIGSLQGQGEIMQRCNAGTDWWDVFGDTVLGAAAGCVTGWFWTPVTSVFEQLVQMIAINFITYQDTQSDFHNCPCDQFGGATNPLG